MLIVFLLLVRLRLLLYRRRSRRLFVLLFLFGLGLLLHRRGGRRFLVLLLFVRLGLALQFCPGCFDVLPRVLWLHLALHRRSCGLFVLLFLLGLHLTLRRRPDRSGSNRRYAPRRHSSAADHSISDLIRLALVRVIAFPD